VPQHAFTGHLFPIQLLIFKREKREFPYPFVCLVKIDPTKSQKNMDYSIFKALNFNMEGIEAALISYDVMCQWSVHMMERVASSDYLNLPDNLELKLAIGLFHIHGHQDTCLARYSPSFIEGGRQIDGETIETLWAPLNEITRST
jgi:Kyakuja-Dileera-Zisupton transposase